MDPILERLTPGPTIPVAPQLLAARDAMRAAVSDLLAVPDGALERPWKWRGGEADVRYGLYEANERLGVAAGAARRALGATGVRATPSAARIAPATLARWDLHGLLAPLEDAALDADPGGGEWTIRQTLGHIVSGQRTYAWFTGWWLSQVGADPFPDRIPDELAELVPDEHGAEGAGGILDIRDRLDAVLDLSASRLGDLDDAALSARARWAGIWVDVGFRLGRWSSHLREHTIQVEKTLVALDRTPREVDRIVRRVLGAYGRLEAEAFALPPSAIDACDERGRSVADAFAVTGDIRSSAASVRAAAGA